MLNLKLGQVFAIGLVGCGLVGCSGFPRHDDEPCDPSDRSCDELHWSLADEGCITTSVHVSQADLLDGFAETIARWNAVECNQPCLAPPVLTDRLPDPELDTRHLAIVPFELLPDPDDYSEYAVVATETYFDTCVLTIDHVIVGVRSDLEPAAALEQSAREFCHVFGLGNDALEDDRASPYPGITMGEVEALCARYGDPPRCDD